MSFNTFKKIQVIIRNKLHFECIIQNMSSKPDSRMLLNIDVAPFMNCTIYEL